MKHFYLLTLFLTLVFFSSAQNSITLRSPIKFTSQQSLSTLKGRSIEKGKPYFIKSIEGNDEGTIFLKVADESGGESYLVTSSLDKLTFGEVNSIEDLWEKGLLTSRTYENLLNNGLQYDRRKDLNDDAIEYMSALDRNGRFFNDDYLEDYLYTLTNKIHRGVLGNSRPGNLNIKIIKDVQPNAFTLPNGCILVSTGLLSTIQSEDELVGVLAHEIAHFVFDHEIQNYNAAIERKQVVEFWKNVTNVLAASADVYMSSQSEKHIPGVLTMSTIIASSIISEEILSRLGVKYNHAQELEADKMAKEVLEKLQYDKGGLAVALVRIKHYNILSGNYYALTSSGSHPKIDTRISKLGEPENYEKFNQSNFIKKTSFVNSYNAWLYLFYFKNYKIANELAKRNIENGVAVEDDYIVKCIVQRRMSNTKESNEEVYATLEKARLMNISPLNIIYKEEGIILLRLDRKAEAKKSFQTYLTRLIELMDKTNDENTSREKFLDEISWTQRMIAKIDSL